MAQTIKLKNSGSSGNTPSSLVHGELALNYADGKIFYKNSSNSIVEFASGASFSGSYNDLTDVPFTYNNITGVSTNADLGIIFHTGGTALQADAHAELTFNPSSNLLKVGGDVTITGSYTADTHFKSSDGNVTLSATGGGGVYLRPDGSTSSSTQLYIQSGTGNAEFSGTISSGAITADTGGSSQNALNIGGSSATNYTLQRWLTSAHSGNEAYIIAYGASHSSEAGNFAIKNLEANSDIFFELAGSVEPLRLTSTGATFAGSVNVSGDLNIASTLAHTGDLDTYFQFNAANTARIVVGGSQKLVINTNGAQISNGTLTVATTSTNGILVSGNTGGLNFTGGNNRIYFGGQRALEGVTSSGNIQIGEGFSGNLLLQMATEVQGQLSVTDGSVGAPSIRFSNDTNTGIYRGGDDNFIIATGGANRVTVTSAGIFSSANLYSGTTGSYRNFAGTWAGTTGTANNGFYFLNTANSNTTKAMELSHDGNVVFAGQVQGSSLDINGGAEISGNTTITGNTSSGNAFLANRGDGGGQGLRVHNTGEVVVPTNYLYAARSSGSAFYAQGSAVFRGGITNDGGNTLSISSGSSNINFNSKNLTSVGSITSSGNLVLDATGHNYIELHSATANTRKWRFYNGQGWNQDALLIYDQDADQTAVTIETGKLGINRGASSLSHNLDVGGSVAISGTQILDSSRNLSNIGTISSGAITSSGQILTTIESSTAIKSRFIMGKAGGSTANGNLYLQYGSSDTVFIGAGSGGAGLDIAGTLKTGRTGINTASVSDVQLKIKTSTNDSTDFAIEAQSANGSALFSLDGAGEVRLAGNVKMSGTTIITSGRGLTNLTLSHGAGGTRFETNDWHRSTDNDQRFYFEASGRTFYKASSHQFRNASNATQFNINTNGHIHIASNGDSGASSTEYIKAGGVAILTSSRVLQNVSGNISMFTNDSNYATQTYVTNAISDLVDSAPSALDTLNELAAALGDDASFSTTVTNSIATKLPLAGGTLTGTLNSKAINMQNHQLYGVNNLRFNDPGVNEGIKWDGGNEWQIYESPDNQTNASGNLQFTTGSGGGTLKATLDTSGNFIARHSSGTTRIGQDGNYGNYGSLGFGGHTNGSNRIFGHYSTGDGLYLASATGRGVFIRTNGGNANNFEFTSGGDLKVAGSTFVTSGREIQNASVAASSSIAPRRRGTASVNNSGYVHAFRVDGDNLASSIRFTVHGTTGSVVINSEIFVSCNHFKDIFIESNSGFYTVLTVKVVSNGNEDFSVYLKTNSANTATVQIEVFPLNNEVITFTSTDQGFTTKTLEHTCEYGKRLSAEDNVSGRGFDIETDGQIDALKYQISGTTVIGADRSLTSINSITSGGNINTTSGGFQINGATVINSSRHINLFTSGSTGTEQINLARGGRITFYGDTNAKHSIGSRDLNGAISDDIRINTYGGLSINLDSNDNNAGNANFTIGRHGGGSSTISELMTVSGETGAINTNSTITAGSTIHRGNLTIDSQEIDVGSGDLALDVAGNITLDAGGGNIDLKEGGTTFGRLQEMIGGLGISAGSTPTFAQLISSTKTLFFGHIELGDNKHVQWGDSGGDLQIYHDGSDSYIKEYGTGALKILTNGLRVRNAADDEDMITANQNGAVNLYHDNTNVLQTMTGGVNITGELQSDSLDVDGAVDIDGNTVITGSSGTGFALEVERGDNSADVLLAYNNGVVQTPNNYLFASRSGGVSFYSQSAAVFRGGILNDQSGQALTVSDDLNITGSTSINGTQIISSSRALSNVTGNISMFTNDAGYLTSATLGSNLNADTVDSLHASSFLRSDANDTMNNTLTFGSGSGFDLATFDIYGSMRVIRNNKSGSDGMYIGYLNSNSGVTRIFGGGQGSGGIYIQGSGANDIKYNNSSTFWHAGNDGSGSGLDADTLDGYQSGYFATQGNLGNYLALSGGTMTGTITSRDLLLQSGYHLMRSNHHTGHLEGSYNNVGGNAVKSNPIYTIGSNYNPLEASLQNMYGIGFAKNSASYMTGDLDAVNNNGWGLYVAADGDARVFLNGSHGIISSTGQHYADGQLVWNAGNDGSGSGLDADTVDGIHGSSLLRSDTADTASGALTLTNNNNHFKAHLFFDEYSSGRHYIHFTTAGSTNQIDWRIQTNNANSVVHQWSNTNAYFATQVQTATQGILWGASNDGSGSGLDADTVDGIQGASFLRSDATDSVSGNYVTTLQKLQFNGVGSNSNNANASYAIYQEAGAWSHPYPDLIIGYHTGIKMGGHTSYGGVRFYNNNPTSGSIIASIGDGDQNFRGYHNGFLRHGGNTDHKIMTVGNDGSGSGFDADTVDGVHASSLYGVTSVATGGGLTGGTITSTGTISHADTSSVSNVNNSGNTFIQDITFDTYGHVTSVTSATATSSGGGGASSSQTVTARVKANRLDYIAATSPATIFTATSGKVIVLEEAICFIDADAVSASGYPVFGYPIRVRVKSQWNNSSDAYIHRDGGMTFTKEALNSLFRSNSQSANYSANMKRFLVAQPRDPTANNPDQQQQIAEVNSSDGTFNSKIELTMDSYVNTSTSEDYYFYFQVKFREVTLSDITGASGMVTI